MAGTVIVDGKRVAIDGDRNLLELVRRSGVDLPTFCYNSELSVYGACRMCMVEDARGALLAACSTQPTDGMEIKTSTPRVQRVRRMMLELLLANHERDCTICPKNGRCKLQDLCVRFGVNRVRFPARSYLEERDESTKSLVRDPNKCILCGDCVRMCSEVQGIGAIDFAYRGASAQVLPAFGKGLGEVDCVNCGQCAAICPTGALVVRPEVDQVWVALRDPAKTTVVQVAPAVRVAIGEEFGLKPGEITTGKAVAALRRLGFDQVWDTSFTADLTTIEETSEFVNRLLNRTPALSQRERGHAGSRLPQFTSCCPAWVKAAEQYYPDKLHQLSTCRSPQQMFGSLVKRFYAKEEGLAPGNVFVVSVMPCTAKKFEASRPEFAPDGVRDVDAVLTTQELARMIKEAGIRFEDLEEESFDSPFGFATGSGVLYGATGGVSTAVVRQAALTLAGQRVNDVEFTPVEGIPGAMAAEVKVGEQPVRIGVVSGLGNARKLIAAIDRGEFEFDIVEIMACPGGCAGGGGQPTPNETRERQQRIRGLHNADRRQQIRVAQDNPLMGEVYRKWLGKPNGEVAHEALHTHYSPRRRIVGEAVELTPPGQSIPTEEPLEVSVCVGTSCYLRGSKDVLNRLGEELKRRDLGDQVHLRAAFCFENCGHGPTVRFDGARLAGVSPDDIPSLIDRYVVKKGKR